MKKTIAFIAILFCCLNSSIAQLPDYISTTKLVGYWPLHNNLIDSSVNAYDGNGMYYSHTTDRHGISNSACEFSHINGHIEFFGLPINTRGDYSINYWINLQSFKEFDVILDLHPSYECGNYPQVWERFDSLNIVKCGLPDSRVNIGHKSEFLNQWRMMTILVNDDSTTIYLDAKQVKKVPYNWDVSANANMSFANSNNWGSSPYGVGANIILDNIGLWGRLISECEIENLYFGHILSLTLEPKSVVDTIGADVRFICGANTSGADYQWQSDMGFGGAYIDLANTGQYSGVTTDTLRVSNLTSANHKQLFRCLVNRGSCQVTSDSASVTVENLGIGTYNLLDNYIEQNVPNPSNGTTIIPYYTNGQYKNCQIIIQDISGKIVKTHPIQQYGAGRLTISGNDLGRGIYLYTLVIEGHKINTKKLIVN